MITLLSHFLIKENSTPEKERSMYGMICGIVGIILNIFLFIGKFIAGYISNSISITADSFNNLSDAGSSIVTLVGFKMAEQKADEEHPYGHGRMEYISGFIVSLIILLMGFELFRDSVTKIIHPENVDFSIMIVIILIASILVKCYMAFYNFKVGNRINSSSVKATAADSLSDCIATSVVLISTIVSHYVDINMDGYAGVLVACFVLYAGYGAAKDTIDPLIGFTPEQDYIDNIKKIVTEYDENIVGMHDLMVHDYGPGHRIISLHAEVPANVNIMKIHDIIDNLEYTLARELGCVATIHIDPIVTDDPHVNMLKEKITGIVKDINSKLSIHDFRVVVGDTHTNVIFDIVVPYRYEKTDNQIKEMIFTTIQEKLGEHYFAVIHVDRENIVG